MSKTVKAVLIPHDGTKPVREVEYDTADYTNLTALIFDGERDGKLFDRMVGYDPDGTQVTLWFDDEGLFRLDNEEVQDIINLRAMELYSFLNGGVPIQQYGVPLVGNYVITGGADEEGENLDAPDWVKDTPFTWHNIYSVEKKEVEG